MNPAKPPPTSWLDDQPEPVAPPVPTADDEVTARLPVGLVGLVAVLGAALLAALAASGLHGLLGSHSAWSAAVAAALGVGVTALPLGWLGLRLARQSEPAESRVGTGPVPALGVAKPLFMDLAQREWARARRYGTGAALLLVDVDRIAQLRQAHGPAAGDAVVVGLLRQTAPGLRTADVLTRFGDARMAVFLAHADATGAIDVAERIRERAEHLLTPFQPLPGLPVTVSVGVAHLRPAHANLQAMVDDVEEALAAARQVGGNCVRAAPVRTGRARAAGAWRDDHRARPQ